jgi:PAS domain-containing protein
MPDGSTAGPRAGLRFHSPLWSGLVPALIAIAGLAILDTQPDLVIIGFFAVVPFTTALSGDVRATAIVAALTVIVVGASGLWNHNYDTVDFWVRYGLVVVGSSFACYVAMMIEGSSRNTRRLDLLDRVAASAGGEPTVAEAVAEITEIAVPELADLCMIDAISAGRVERLAVKAHGPRAAEVEAGIAERDPTVSPAVVGSGKDSTDLFMNRFVSDYDLEQMAHSAEDLAFLRSLGVRSYLSVALRSRGRLVGVMTLVQAWSGRRHDEDDALFTRALAGRVALALDIAGLFSDLESIEMRMDTVMSMLEEPVSISDRAGKLVFVNEAAVALAGAESRRELLESEADGPKFDIYDETDALIARDRFPWELDRGFGGRIVRLVHPLHGEEQWLRIRSSDIEGADGRPIYTVSAFEDVTEMKLAEFAQGVFTSIAEMLSTATDPERILERLVHLVIPRLADASAVLVPTADGTLKPIAISHVDPVRERELRELIDQVALNRDAPDMPEMLASREPIVYDAADPAGWPEGAAPIAVGMDALGMGCVMGQPLRIGTRLIGVIGFANRVERRPFTALERRVALRISERVALSIDIAEAAGERREIAETLQQGLRPSAIPSIPGWSIAGLYSPAGPMNQAGGDFYDLLRIEGGWMAVIGDVTGHGARAASLTAMARYTLRTASTMTNDPHRALAELNRALLQRPEGALCSVAAFTLDQPARGTVRVALAGHPPPLLVRGDEVTEIEPAGPVLGAFDDATWEIESLALEPGDRFLVYTDGVVEARGESDRFGEERLSRCVGSVPNPSETIGRIRAELMAFAGELTDDAAALAVMLEPAEPDLRDDRTGDEREGQGRSAVSAG